MLLWERDFPPVGGRLQESGLIGPVKRSPSSYPALRCGEWLGPLLLSELDGEKKNLRWPDLLALSLPLFDDAFFR